MNQHFFTASCKQLSHQAASIKAEIPSQQSLQLFLTFQTFTQDMCAAQRGGWFTSVPLPEELCPVGRGRAGPILQGWQARHTPQGQIWTRVEKRATQTRLYTRLSAHGVWWGPFSNTLFNNQYGRRRGTYQSNENMYSHTDSWAFCSNNDYIKCGRN